MKKLLTVSAVLAMFCLMAVTPTNSATPLTPDDMYELKYILLYEAGYEGLAYGQRVYKEYFPKSTTRYIYVEVTLENILYNVMDHSHKILVQFYRPDKSLFGETVMDVTVKSEWQASRHTTGWGWSQPGHWSAGTYGVKVWMMDSGTFLGYKEFVIYNDTSPSQDPFKIGKKLAMSGRFELGSVWVKDNWDGDGVTYSFHITYSESCKLVAFVERPLSRQGLQIMWAKDYRNNRYVKLIGNVGGEITDTIPITQEKAEREAWRILKYFDY